MVSVTQDSPPPETTLCTCQLCIYFKTHLQKMRIIICLSFFLSSSFFFKYSCVFTFSKWTDNLNAAIICSLNKRLFMNRESVDSGENFSGKKTFHSKVNAKNMYKLPNCFFFDFYFMRAHSKFCCLVSGGRGKLFTCEKVVSPASGLPYLPRRDNSPPRVVSTTSCKRLI